MAYLIKILVIVSFVAGLVTANLPLQPLCNKHPYGQLKAGQCAALSRSFADGSDDKIRIFDEEQLTKAEDGSWPGIINPFRTDIVQIPRIWSDCMSCGMLVTFGF